MKNKVVVNETMFIEAYRRYEELDEKLSKINKEIADIVIKLNAGGSIGAKGSDTYKQLKEQLRQAKTDKMLTKERMRQLESILYPFLTPEYALLIVENMHQKAHLAYVAKFHEYDELFKELLKKNEEIERIPRTETRERTIAYEQKQKLEKKAEKIKEERDAELNIRQKLESLLNNKDKAYEYLRKQVGGPFSGKRKLIKGKKLRTFVKKLEFDSKVEEPDAQLDLIAEAIGSIQVDLGDGVKEQELIENPRSVEIQKPVEASEPVEVIEDAPNEKKTNEEVKTVTDDQEKRDLEIQIKLQYLKEERRRIDEEIRTLLGYDPSKPKDKKEIK